MPISKNIRTVLKVGVGGYSYTEVRNVISLPFKGVQFTRVHDVMSVLHGVVRRLWGPVRSTSIVNCLHCDFGLNNVDLLHLYNTISCSRRPWFVTFEDYLPRWDVHSEFGMRYLAAKECKGIIAMSRFAFGHQVYHLGQFAAYKDDILGKMCTLHPSQEPLIGSYADKHLTNDVITFTFVGSDFFRKGGKEILLAFKRLVDEHLPIKLNIVSTLNYGDYASRSTPEDYRSARGLIRTLGNHVTHYETLPNADVLKLLVASHVGLLPTYDDTYGFSVLEAQGAGCPVITTDVCALPEFNNNDVGWLINVPHDEFGIAIRQTAEQRRNLSDSIQDGLYTIIKHICSRPETLQSKGSNALQRIIRECSPSDRADTLYTLYRNALYPNENHDL